MQDHHEAYVSWEDYQRNQERLARSSFCKPAGGAKAARGGLALMAGLLRCRRCGRMLQVLYTGHGARHPRYSCRRGHAMQGLNPCIGFGARRPDSVVAKEILVALQPLAIEAAIVAEREVSEQIDEQRRALELELQQAQYEVKIAARRHQAVDPDNRLVAAELEARWNAALTKLRAVEDRAADKQRQTSAPIDRDALLTLADNLELAWAAVGTAQRTRQRLVRALIEEIVVDVDDTAAEIVLLIHWRGGQHSELRVRRPAPGEHTRRAPEEAAKVIREMATRWSDEDIAATLNRMGLQTGQGLSWNGRRVASYRRKTGIPGYESAVKDGRCLTLVEAATKLGVSCHAIRKLIREGILPARQVLFDAPWQILATDLERPEVQQALRRRSRRPGRPCRNSRDDRTLKIPGI